MRIGVDLDNTLADYRRPLERLCALHGIEGVRKDPKLALREELRARGEEATWTRLQGELYGPLMQAAELFTGAAEVLGRWQSSGAEVFVVSHRTRYPVAGAKHDLHAHARRWIGERGLRASGIFFEESKDEKIARIGSLQCDVFVDDLPEVLLQSGFPVGTRRVLFDPGLSHGVISGVQTAATWADIEGLVRS
jgi:hypothetical protein